MSQVPLLYMPVTRAKSVTKRRSCHAVKCLLEVHIGKLLACVTMTTPNPQRTHVGWSFMSHLAIIATILSELLIEIK